MFGLTFAVEVVVGYNPIMHKTQPQKLIFLAFHNFLVGPTPKPQPPRLTQTPSRKGNLKREAEGQRTTKPSIFEGNYDQVGYHRVHLDG